LLEFLGEIGKFFTIRIEVFLPARFGFLTAADSGAEARLGFLGNIKRRIERPAEFLLGALDFSFAEGRAVRFEGVLFSRRTETDVGAE